MPRRAHYEISYEKERAKKALLDKRLEAARESKNKEEEAQVLFDLVAVLVDVGFDEETEQANIHAQDLIKLRREFGDESKLAAALVQHGVLLYSMGCVEEANGVLREGLQLAQKIGDKELEITTNLELCYLYEEIAEEERREIEDGGAEEDEIIEGLKGTVIERIHFAKAALRICEENNNEESKNAQDAVRFIADSYEEIACYEEALPYFDKLITFARKSADQDQLRDQIVETGKMYVAAANRRNVEEDEDNEGEWEEDELEDEEKEEEKPFIKRANIMAVTSAEGKEFLEKMEKIMRANPTSTAAAEDGIVDDEEVDEEEENEYSNPSEEEGEKDEEKYGPEEDEIKEGAKQNDEKIIELIAKARSLFEELKTMAESNNYEPWGLYFAYQGLLWCSKLMKEHHQRDILENKYLYYAQHPKVHMLDRTEILDDQAPLCALRVGRLLFHNCNTNIKESPISQLNNDSIFEILHQLVPRLTKDQLLTIVGIAKDKSTLKSMTKAAFLDRIVPFTKVKRSEKRKLFYNVDDMEMNYHL